LIRADLIKEVEKRTGRVKKFDKLIKKFDCRTMAERRDGFAKSKKKKKGRDLLGGGGFLVSRWFFPHCRPPGLPFLS
jgi:hypothetical protein